MVACVFAHIQKEKVTVIYKNWYFTLLFRLYDVSPIITLSLWLVMNNSLLQVMKLLSLQCGAVLHSLQSPVERLFREADIYFYCRSHKQDPRSNKLSSMEIA